MKGVIWSGVVDKKGPETARAPERGRPPRVHSANLRPPDPRRRDRPSVRCGRRAVLHPDGRHPPPSVRTPQGTGGARTGVGVESYQGIDDGKMTEFHYLKGQLCSIVIIR